MKIHHYAKIQKFEQNMISLICIWLSLSLNSHLHFWPNPGFQFSSHRRYYLHFNLPKIQKNFKKYELQYSYWINLNYIESIWNNAPSQKVQQFISFGNIFVFSEDSNNDSIDVDDWKIEKQDWLGNGDKNWVLNSIKYISIKLFIIPVLICINKDDNEFSINSNYRSIICCWKNKIYR